MYTLPAFVSPGPRGGMGVLLGYTPQIPIQSPVSSGAVGPKGTVPGRLRGAFQEPQKLRAQDQLILP